MWKEFREFAAKGNVIDLAVGVILGGAFNKIVTSLVDDVLMPILGLITGGLDLGNLFLSLSGTRYPTVADAKQAGVATLNYGLFANAVINFLLMAFALFLLVKWANRMRAGAAKPPGQPAA